MVSKEHTISWKANSKMDPDDVTWSSPSHVSVLKLKKESVTDDQVYTCKVRANAKSEIAEIQVHLNFYCKLTGGLTCAVTDISYMLQFGFFVVFR
jgi:transcription initiation factor IIE alpha subunit